MFKTIAFASVITVFSLGACQTITTQTEPSIVTDQAAPANTQAVSNADFTTTNARLKSAIETRGLTLFAVVDHAAGAAKIGQTLAPNTLYIFGNPKAGTPLMLADPTLGLHLPLKAQVREDNGQVLVTVSDIRAIATEPAPVVGNIAGALNAIMAEAAGT